MSKRKAHNGVNTGKYSVREAHIFLHVVAAEDVRIMVCMRGRKVIVTAHF